MTDMTSEQYRGVVTEPGQLWELPIGSVIESLPTCGWPQRYAGRRWTRSEWTMTSDSPDPLTGEMTAGAINYFRDPLPAAAIIRRVREADKG